MADKTDLNGSAKVSAAKYGQPNLHFPLLKVKMTEYVQERTQQQPENPFASLIPDQTIAIRRHIAQCAFGVQHTRKAFSKPR